MGKQELLEGLFRKYGSPSDHGEIRICRYFLRADALRESEQIKYYDKSAAETIKEMERTIEALKAYRETLQERYSYLSTAAFLPVVKLRREKHWKGPVVYYLEFFRKYVDSGEEVEEDYIKFSGTERHKAIKAYKEYVKQHPGIITEMDIEKGKFE